MRTENLVASALLKFIQALCDADRSYYELYFLRDKDKREVDFRTSQHYLRRLATDSYGYGYGYGYGYANSGKF